MNNKFFSALAEPNRLKIVELLIKGPLSVGEIAQQLELNQPQTTKHLQTLNQAGIVERKPKANKRVYELKGEAFVELDEWLESFRHMCEQRFDRLENYLEALQRNDN